MENRDRTETMKEWMIPTHNDPLGAVRGVLETLWESENLERILLPVNGNFEITGPSIIENREEIQKFNPFTPLMPFNAAKKVPELVESGMRVAAVLRPCEMRSLTALVQRERLTIDNLVTVSVDCLGTLPADEFEWRAHRKGSPRGLTQEALQFAPQGGITPYRYRAACQICKSPEAREADINIGVLGLPVRQYLFIQAREVETARQIKKKDALPMDEAIARQHRRVTNRLIERGQSTRQRIFRGMIGVLPSTIDSLIEPFQKCKDCRSCLEACPICTNDYPRQDADGRFNREDIMEWLVSCSGCGMCEQACPKHLPLTIIFGHIQQQLSELQ